jgi:hypothetical protein
MNPPDPEPQPRLVPERRTKKVLTREQRQQIVSRLLWELNENGNDGKFARGTIPAVAAEFHMCPKTIRRIWARAVQNFEDPDVRQFSASPQKKNFGRHKKWNNDEVREASDTWEKKGCYGMVHCLFQ